MSTLEYSIARIARVRWVPLLLTLAAWPFTAVGAVGAAAVIAFWYAVDAVKTGYADVRDRYPRRKIRKTPRAG